MPVQARNASSGHRRSRRRARDGANDPWFGDGARESRKSVAVWMAVLGLDREREGRAGKPSDVQNRSIGGRPQIGHTEIGLRAVIRRRRP